MFGCDTNELNLHLIWCADARAIANRMFANSFMYAHWQYWQQHATNVQFNYDWIARLIRSHFADISITTRNVFFQSIQILFSPKRVLFSCLVAKIYAKEYNYKTCPTILFHAFQQLYQLIQLEKQSQWNKNSRKCSILFINSSCFVKNRFLYDYFFFCSVRNENICNENFEMTAVK